MATIAVDVMARNRIAIITGTKYHHIFLKKNGNDIAKNKAKKLLFPSVPVATSPGMPFLTVTIFS